MDDELEGIEDGRLKVMGWWWEDMVLMVLRTRDSKSFELQTRRSYSWEEGDRWEVGRGMEYYQGLDDGW